MQRCQMQFAFFDHYYCYHDGSVFFCDWIIWIPTSCFCSCRSKSSGENMRPYSPWTSLRWWGKDMSFLPMYIYIYIYGYMGIHCWSFHCSTFCSSWVAEESSMDGGLFFFLVFMTQLRLFFLPSYILFFLSPVPRTGENFSLPYPHDDRVVATMPNPHTSRPAVEWWTETVGGQPPRLQSFFFFEGWMHRQSDTSS